MDNSLLDAYHAILLPSVTNHLSTSLFSMSKSSSKPELTELHKFCRQGNKDAVFRLLRKGGSELGPQLEQHIGFFGYTPLHEATNQGHHEIVHLLLIYSVNVNAEAHDRYTPLHIAASMDYKECIKVLLEHNADIYRTDIFGKTPYDTAVTNGRKGAARLLKTAGKV